MAPRIPEPSKLATPEGGHPWHPTKDVILLFGVNYSILDLLKLLKDWNNKGERAETKVCKLDHLRATLSVAHYCLTRLHSDPSSGQAPLNLSDNEVHKHFKAGSNCFWEFTHLLSLLEKDTHVGRVAVGEESLVGLYVKNLEGSKEMDMLRESVDHNYNPVVVRYLKGAMEDEAWKSLIYDLEEIEGVNAKLLA